MQDEYQHGNAEVQYDRSYGQPKALHGVKADERLFGIGLYQQEDDGWNKRKVGDRGRGIVRQATLRRHVACDGGSRSWLRHLSKAAAWLGHLSVAAAWRRWWRRG